MPCRVELAPAAQRNLEKLLRDAQARMAVPILALADNPRPSGARKIIGQQHAWRIRVGPFRIIYDVYDELRLVAVLKVDRRQEAT